jgi:hypothetical protein
MKAWDGVDGKVCFHCPGCDGPHGLTVKQRVLTGWDWNGLYSTPTFSPSILVRGQGYVCHSYVRNGRIQFLPDTTHKLSGQEVELPDE